MGMFNWNGVASEAVSVMPDDTTPIDYVLDEGTVKKIYDNWDESSMQSLVDYGGGVRAITALMVREAGVDFLTSIKGFGPKRATEIMGKITETVQEVPYV